MNNQFKTKLQVVRECAEDVAGIFGIHPDDILKETRGSPKECAARFCVYERLRKRKWSYPQIGTTMNRDHQSVLSGVRRIKDARTNPNNVYYEYLQEVLPKLDRPS